MKWGWLILAVSVTCLLVLAPAAALAQQISIGTDPEGCMESWTDRDSIRFLALYSSG